MKHELLDVDIVRKIKHDYFPQGTPLYELCEKIHRQLSKKLDLIEFNARLAEGKTDIWVINDKKDTETDFTDARNNGDVIDVLRGTLGKHFWCTMISGMKHHDEESDTHYMKVKLIGQK